LSDGTACTPISSQRYQDLRHFLILLKEDTVEVVAAAIQILRVDASSSAEASGSLTRA